MSLLTPLSLSVSTTGAPSSISFRISIICFSLNLLFRINAPDLFYQNYSVFSSLVFGEAYKTIESFEEPTDIVDDENSYLTENNKHDTRKVEVFQNKSADLVMYSKSFNNIQSLIKVTKTLTSPITGEVTTTHQYLIANFKTTAKEFHQKILQHWRVETYLYHLDMLMEEE